MSMMLMVKAMNTKVGNPLRKLILIKLADNANDKGECWPSHQHIADLCEVSKSTVRKHIKELCECGLLKITHRDGPKGNSSNLYHLTIHPMPSESIGVPSDDTPPMPSGDTRTSHSLEPVKEPKRTDKSVVDFSVLGISDEYIAEVRRIRRANKGGAITQRVANALAKEFHKAANAGITLEDLLTEWEVRGWKSFKCEWMKPNETIRQNGNAANVKPSEIDKLNQAMLDKYGQAPAQTERTINPDGYTGLDPNEVQGGVHAALDGNGITIDMDTGD